MAIRRGARRVKVHNSSLGVYLYDPANGDAIRSKDVELSDPKDLVALGGTRLLVCYGLGQDDDLDIEVVVGPPLTEKELAAGRWIRPQRTRLDVPSGTLHIDSPDTLRLRDEQPTDEGATLEVPPGEYVLTLYRIFEEQLEAEGIEKYRGAAEVVVLTPAENAEPVESEAAYLEILPETPRLPWQKVYAISGDCFEGLVGWWSKGIVSTNLDREAAAVMGLEFGAALRLEAGGKLGQTAIYLADRMNFGEYLDYFGQARAREHPGLDGAWFGGPDALGDDGLKFGIPKAARIKRLSPITITKLASPIDPIDDVAWFGAVSVSGGEVAGTVVRLYWENDCAHLVLSADQAVLGAIGAQAGDRLLLDVGGVVHALPLYQSENALWRASDLPQVPVELTLAYQEVRAGRDDASRTQAASLWKKLDALRRARVGAVLPVGAFLRPDKRRPEKLLLEVMPMVFPFAWIDAPYPAFDFATEPGTPFRVRKADARHAERD